MSGEMIVGVLYTDGLYTRCVVCWLTPPPLLHISYSTGRVAERIDQQHAGGSEKLGRQLVGSDKLTREETRLG